MGKIKAEAKSVKVYADVSLVFPLIVAATLLVKSHRIDRDYRTNV